MNSYRLPTIRVGDIIEVDQGHYCYGLGKLLLEVIEVGHRERHTDGVWLNLRGVELHQTNRVRLRQRRVLVRLSAIRIRPGPLTRRRWIRRPIPANQPAAAAVPSRPPLVHAAGRPSWICVNCGADWPCPTRRARLLAKYADDRLSLQFYLSWCLSDAMLDLRHLPPQALHARFLGWARHGPEEAR